MDKEEFMELYRKHSIKELCKMFKCSNMTIYRRLKEFDIQLKGKGNGKRGIRKLIIGD